MSLRPSYRRHQPRTPSACRASKVPSLPPRPPERRARVHTDASDCVLEEDATCYLQIVLADGLSGVGSDRLMADMDAWGYSFRLGSARAWFERDAEDALAWLMERGLLPD